MNDLDFMARAIELAARGRLKVQPNPMVGCVIVKNNKIIGEAGIRNTVMIMQK